jgi:hypothetical protein
MTDLAGAGVDAGDHLSDRNFGYPFADQANGGSIRGMLEAIDLIEKLAGHPRPRPWDAGEKR